MAEKSVEDKTIEELIDTLCYWYEQTGAERQLGNIERGRDASQRALVARHHLLARLTKLGVMTTHNQERT